MKAEERAGPVAWAGIVATTCLLLVLLRHTLWLVLPFVVGGVMYYILLEPMQRLVRAGASRNLSAMLVCSVFFTLLALALAGVFSWAGPGDAWQAAMARYVDGGLAFVRSTAAALEARFPILRGMHLRGVANRSIRVLTNDFAQQHLGALLLAAAGWLPSLLLAPFLTFFFLRDGVRFKKFLARAVPNAYFEKALFLLHQVDQIARRYFEGLVRLTILDTAVLALGLWTIGVSSPVVLGLISALLAWVPFVGSVAGCVLVVVVASTDSPGSPMMAYGAIAVFVLARLLDDFVFMPLTLGRSLRIHPLVTVLMIFAGGAVAGVAGLMLVLPLLGVVMLVGETLARLLTNPRLRARHRNALALRTQQASADLSL
jgi:predicted PurR-regulated permease PerM